MMKKFLLIISLIYVSPVLSSTDMQDYSKLSQTELNEQFVTAVKKDSVKELEAIIKAGADTNTPIDYSWTHGDCDWQVETSAMTYAVQKNRPGIVKVLAPKEKNLNQALDVAINEGFDAIVEVLIEAGVNINATDEDNETPLIKAVRSARPEAEYSLQAQAQYRSRWQQRQNIIQILLEAGADITIQTKKLGRTALMEAVINHDLYTVETLLQHKDINNTTFFGFTKLVNYADNDGNTAVILAVEHIRYTYINSQEYNMCINTQKILELLFEHPGIDVHHVNNNGETAITLYYLKT